VPLQVRLFTDAVSQLKVMDEGLFEQLNAFVLYVPPESQLDCINELHTNESWSLPDLVLLWTGYQKSISADLAVQLANRCLDLLKKGEFDRDVLQRAITFLGVIPTRTFGSRALNVPEHFAWITQPTPVVAGVEILLEWCCNSSLGFRKAFISGFESIFTGPSADPNLLTLLLPIFLKNCFALADVQLIENLVEKVRVSSRDSPIIAPLFEALSKLNADGLRQLASVTSKIWKDLSAGEAEMNYVRKALPYCDDASAFQWLRQLEGSVLRTLNANKKCPNSIVPEFQRLYSCGELLSGKLRAASRLTAVHLDGAFTSETAGTLAQLLKK
jgi:hypothetical protein